MNYVVVDLEWNQYHNPLRTPLSRSGVMMHEEIIQIGAIKTDHDMNPVDTFKTFVRLGNGRRLDRYVKKLTHITDEDIASGEDFIAAAPMFTQWLSDVDGIFSWGPDDRRVLLNNLAFYGLEAPVCKWYDAQKIYKSQVPGNGGMALKKVAEAYGLYVNLTLHDALNDAVLTSVCMAKLDMEKGVSEYARTPARQESEDGFPTPLAVFKTHHHRTQQAAWDEACANPLRCPECMRVLEWTGAERGSLQKWYKAAKCPEHGDYMVRGEFLGEKTPYIRYCVYLADEKLAACVESDLAGGAKLKKRRRRRRKKPSEPMVLDTKTLVAKAVAAVAEAYQARGDAIGMLTPMESAQIAATMTGDAEIVAAALLRGAARDIDTFTREAIEKPFGHRTAALACLPPDDKDQGEPEKILRLTEALPALRALTRKWAINDPDAAEKKALMTKHRDEADALADLINYGAYQEYVRLVDTVFGKKRRRKADEA